MLKKTYAMLFTAKGKIPGQQDYRSGKRRTLNMKKKIIALFLTGVMLVGTSVQAQAGRIVKPIDEQLAERKVITTPQERKSVWERMRNQGLSLLLTWKWMI